MNSIYWAPVILSVVILAGYVKTYFSVKQDNGKEYADGWAKKRSKFVAGGIAAVWIFFIVVDFLSA